MGSLGGMILVSVALGAVLGTIVGLLVGAAFTRRRTRRRTQEWALDDVEPFLRVGRFSLDEYLDLDGTTRAALAHVARMMEVDAIVARSAAGHSEDATVALGAQLDGGAAAQENIMGRTLAGIAQVEREKATRAAQTGVRQ